ncbi:cytochrome P450 [Xylaria intraflava]|nr:cytochrome P450 [Xylaria intraflava]
MLVVHPTGSILLLSTNVLINLHTVIKRLQEEYAWVRNGIGPLRLTNMQILSLFLRKTWLDLQNSWYDASFGARAALLVFLYFMAMFAVDGVSTRYTSLTSRGFPRLRRPNRQRRWDFRAQIEEGARLFPNSPYIIRCSGFEHIVYPSSSFDEIKSLPVAQASVMEYFAHCFFQGWHFLGREVGALHKALSVDLTRSLPARVRERQALMQGAFYRVVAPCPEWKSIRLYGTIQKLVAMTNAPALVGRELGTDPRWLSCLDMFVYTLVFALFALSFVPRVLHPVAKYVVFAPNWFLYWRLKRLAYPAAERELQEYNESQKPQAISSEKLKVEKTRLGTFLLQRYEPQDRTKDRLAHDFIVTMFESMASTVCTLYLILSELVLRPELADELRVELKANLIEGQLPISQLSELRKMDSLMCETTRINIFSYLTVFRRLMKPVKLSIGPEVPAGAIICVDGYNMVRSKAKWQNPDEFDPKRFLKLRQQPGHENLHQYASLDSSIPNWGGGSQACPGRFFASNSIKVFLTHLLLNYDIKLPAGMAKPSVGSMPNGSAMPDMQARIMIRERRESRI